MPSKIDDQPALTIAEITARTRKAKAEFERSGKSLDLVVVDHIGKVKASKAYRGQRVYEVGEITEGLTALAKNEDVAVHALSQINRNVEDRENKRPQLSDLRESGNIEQDADAVWFVYRPAYYLERIKENGEKEAGRQTLLDKKKNIIEIWVAKTRNGQISSIELFCDIAGIIYVT